MTVTSFVTISEIKTPTTTTKTISISVWIYIIFASIILLAFFIFLCLGEYERDKETIIIENSTSSLPEIITIPVTTKTTIKPSLESTTESSTTTARKTSSTTPATTVKVQTADPKGKSKASKANIDWWIFGFILFIQQIRYLSI